MCPLLFSSSCNATHDRSFIPIINFFHGPFGQSIHRKVVNKIWIWHFEDPIWDETFFLGLLFLEFGSIWCQLFIIPQEVTLRNWQWKSNLYSLECCCCEIVCSISISAYEAFAIVHISINWLDIYFPYRIQFVVSSDTLRILPISNIVFGFNTIEFDYNFTQRSTFIASIQHT